MMKLTTNNIARVIEKTCEGTTYGWFVVMKSGYVSDSRNFMNYDNGKTVFEKYPFSWLPKAVQKFIENHPRTVRGIVDDFVTYEYR